MKEYLKRFKNVGTVISMVSLVGLLLIQLGVTVDMEWLDTTIKLICSIGVVAGVMNNPETKGLDIPKTINSTKVTDFRK